MSNIKSPPLLEKSPSYETWEKSLKLWQLVTDLKATQQGPAIALSLTGKAREAVLELPMEDIKSETGVERILTELSKIYKRDTVETAYEAFDEFIKFNRGTKQNISQFIIEFER